MTVKELIEKLKKTEQNKNLVFYSNDEILKSHNFVAVVENDGQVEIMISDGLPSSDGMNEYKFKRTVTYNNYMDYINSDVNNWSYVELEDFNKHNEDKVIVTYGFDNPNINNADCMELSVDFVKKSDEEIDEMSFSYLARKKYNEKI